MTRWAERVEQRNAEIRDAGRWRRPRPFDAAGPRGTLVEEGREVVSFASNDYLGLSNHPAVVAAGTSALERWGAGSGASRLVTGSRPVHHELEAALADHAGAERAVVFPTGYSANVGLLSALGEPGVRLYSDELNHASIVDGARLSRADVQVYPHRDVEALARMLGESARPSVVVTDTVFSMDGDVAPLQELVELCRAHEALLVLDEAHAVLGPDPGPLLGDVGALRVGTLSKTLGALGGYVAGPASLVELLENRARTYIFTTALPPAVAAAALAALEILHSEEGEALRARLRRYVDLLAPGHPSPILPVVVGTEEAALAASASLLEAGMWVPAIRPPTVAPGTCRLRVTVSAAHRHADVERLALAVAALGDPVGAL